MARYICRTKQQLEAAVINNKKIRAQVYVKLYSQFGYRFEIYKPTIYGNELIYSQELFRTKEDMQKRVEDYCSKKNFEIIKYIKP
jgi:hypothetical protein